MRIGTVLVTIVFVLAFLSGCAIFRSKTEHGHDIAEQWCSECHRVAPDDPSGMRPGHILPPQVVAPSFMDIAARPEVDDAWLHRFTSDIHLPMPIFRLDDHEREFVIAYILSLKPPR